MTDAAFFVIGFAVGAAVMQVFFKRELDRARERALYWETLFINLFKQVNERAKKVRILDESEVKEAP